MSMELVSYLPTFSPNLLIAAISLGWLLARAWKVLNTPTDELVKLLGLEVPVAPLVSLLDLTSTTVTFHWKTPEHHSKDLHFAIKINGGHAADLPYSESAAVVSNLKPGQCYSIRVVAVNSATFSAASDPLQVRCQDDESEGLRNRNIRFERIPGGSAPTVTPYRGVNEGSTGTAGTPSAREPSGTITMSKRRSVSRPSPSLPSAKSRSVSEEKADAESIQTLTSRLDSLRTQLQELQTQDEEEEVEFQQQQEELIQQRDDLRRQLKDRDEQNKELAKSVKSLEHANSAAQTKRSQAEKALQDKLRSREKMQEDMDRWEREMKEMDNDSQTMREQLNAIEGQTKQRIAEIKSEQAPDLEALSAIEDQIQQKGKEMQELDKERKILEEASDQPELAERDRAMVAEEREWTDRISALQHELHDASTCLLQMRTYCQQVQQHYEIYTAGRRGSPINDHGPQSTAGMDQGLPDPAPSHHTQNTRINFDVPEPRQNATVHTRNETTSTASYRTSSPFHNPPSSIPLPARSINSAGSPEQIANSLTGGALMSPSAGALLPTGLLGDDTEEMVKPRLRGLSDSLPGQTQSRPTSRMSRPMSNHFGRSSDFGRNSARSGLETDSLPGLGIDPGQADRDGPSSPGASSYAPSGYPSPHNSFANLHQHRGSDPNIENDRRSIRSASGSSRMLPSSWRNGLGALGRQRGNTLSDDGPMLGSLKSTHSQSMPRETGDTLPGLGGRMSSKPTTGFFGFGRKSAVATNTMTDFGAIGSPLRGSNSRPESTYSAENALPEPSDDSPRFGWTVGRSNSTRTGRLNPWSPLNSRRQSVQHDPAEALEDIGDEDEEDDDDLPNGELPAPIGTKPKKRQSSRSTQLNPNARDFTSMFGFGRRADKTDKAGSKSKSKRSKATTPESSELTLDFGADNSPSADSRKSRDTVPSSFTDSFDDIAEEPDTLSSTPQDSLTPSSTGASARGSLMRRITSKGSTGKFLGLKSSKKNTSNANASNEDIDEDTASGSQSSKFGPDSITSNPLSTPHATPVATPTPTQDKRSSTSSFFSSIGRRSRKKANEAPSISENSLTGDEEDAVRESVDGTSLKSQT